MTIKRLEARKENGIIERKRAKKKRYNCCPYLEGLGGPVLLPEVHEAGHLVLGHHQLLPPPVSQREVG